MASENGADEASDSASANAAAAASLTQVQNKALRAVEAALSSSSSTSGAGDESRPEAKKESSKKRVRFSSSKRGSSTSSSSSLPSPPEAKGVCTLKFPTSKKYRVSAARLIKWSVAPGAEVEKGQMLAIVGLVLIDGNAAPASAANAPAEKASKKRKRSDGPKIRKVKLKAPHDGKVINFLVETGFEGPLNTSLARLDYCTHPLVVGGLCGACGRKALPPQTNGRSSSPTSGAPKVITQTLFGGQKLQVSFDEAKRQHRAMKSQLLKSRKLSLVLDLDLTLLHCTVDPRALEFARSKGVNDVHEIQVQGIKHYLKLRDGMRAWLKTLTENFVLHIYTHGTREYAETCARIMDPDDVLFRRRIISRTDVPELGSLKSLKTVFPMDDRMVLILDDNANVWQGCKNLITVKAYHFFRGMEGVNAIGNEASSSLASSKEKTPLKAGGSSGRTDRGLMHLRDLLSWTHDKFYEKIAQGEEENSVDVKEVLGELKRTIFSTGSSSVWAYIDKEGLAPSLVLKYTRALIECGARIMSNIDDKRITHIITANRLSPSAAEGKRRSVWVVSPDWVLASAHNWNRENEARFCWFNTYGEK